MKSARDIAFAAARAGHLEASGQAPLPFRLEYRVAQAETYANRYCDARWPVGSTADDATGFRAAESIIGALESQR